MRGPIAYTASFCRLLLLQISGICVAAREEQSRCSENVETTSLVLQGGKRKGGKGASVSLFLCGDVEEIFR